MRKGNVHTRGDFMCLKHWLALSDDPRLRMSNRDLRTSGLPCPCMPDDSCLEPTARPCTHAPAACIRLLALPLGNGPLFRSDAPVYDACRLQHLHGVRDESQQTRGCVRDVSCCERQWRRLPGPWKVGNQPATPLAQPCCGWSCMPPAWCPPTSSRGRGMAWCTSSTLLLAAATLRRNMMPRMRSPAAGGK